MGRRILNRKDLRADFDAAERRKPEDEEVVDEDADAEDEDEEEEEGEEKAEDDEEAEVDADAGDEDEGDEDEDAPKKKKKKKVVKVKEPKAVKPKSRSRAAKVVRQRLVWGVFNNSHQCVATYEYPKRQDAESHAAKLTADKKNTHFVQPVKEPIEEKKEKV